MRPALILNLDQLCSIQSHTLPRYKIGVAGPILSQLTVMKENVLFLDFSGLLFVQLLMAQRQ